MKSFKELREKTAAFKKEDAATDKAVKDFLSKGGKIKKLAPGKAAGYHGKDDPGKGMAGMMDKGDTKAIGTRKKVKSMGEEIGVKVLRKGKEVKPTPKIGVKKVVGGKEVKSMENYQVQKYADGKKDGEPKSFGGNLKKATDHASAMRKKTGGNYQVHKAEGYKSYAQQKAVWASRADAKKGKK